MNKKVITFFVCASIKVLNLKMPLKKKIRSKLRLDSILKIFLIISLCGIFLTGFLINVNIKRIEITRERLINTVKHEEFYLNPEPNVLIAGDLFLPETIHTYGAYPIVILQHGLNGRKENMQSMALTFVSKGFIVAMIDLRGHYESTGYCTFGNKEAQDILLLRKELIAQAARFNILITSISLVGHSLGALAVTLAAQSGLFDSCVAIAPPTNISNMLTRFSTINEDNSPKYFITLNNFSNPDFRNNITLMGKAFPKNFLMIAGYEDITVPEKSVKEYFLNNTNNTGQIWKTYGNFLNGTAYAYHPHHVPGHGAEQYPFETPDITKDALNWTLQAIGHEITNKSLTIPLTALEYKEIYDIYNLTLYILTPIFNLSFFILILIILKWIFKDLSESGKIIKKKKMKNKKKIQERENNIYKNNQKKFDNNNNNKNIKMKHFILKILFNITGFSLGVLIYIESPWGATSYFLVNLLGAVLAPIFMGIIFSFIINILSIIIKAFISKYKNENKKNNKKINHIDRNNKFFVGNLENLYNNLLEIVGLVSGLILAIVFIQRGIYLMEKTKMEFFYQSLPRLPDSSVDLASFLLLITTPGLFIHWILNRINYYISTRKYQKTSYLEQYERNLIIPRWESLLLVPLLAFLIVFIIAQFVYIPTIKIGFEGVMVSIRLMVAISIAIIYFLIEILNLLIRKIFPTISFGFWFIGYFITWILFAGIPTI